jgi:hypothetical protein
MESLIDNNAAVIEASATLHANPPAALPVAASRDAPVNGAGPPWFQPAPDHAPAPAVWPAAIDTGNPAAPAAESPAHTAVSFAATAQTDVAPDLPGTGEPAAEMTEVAHAGDMIAAAPQAVSAHVEAPQAQDTPAEPAREVLQNSPPGQTGTGGWVINLASYASESIAARKLADFESKGVAAEQVAATVNGKPIYRVRIGGFDTRKSATARAETIRQQLGLKETWVTKQ